MSSNGTKTPKAPRPGIGRRIEETDAASSAIKIRLKDQTRVLMPGAVSMKIRATLDTELGMSFEDCVASLSKKVQVHTLFALWFVAGAQADPNHSFAADEAAFNALVPTLGENDVDVEILAKDEAWAEVGDHPES
jgi:hypothetical protein